MKSLLIALALVAVTLGAGNVVFAQTADPPPAPTNLTASNGASIGEVSLTWNAVPEAAFYRIGWVAKPDYEATVAAGRDWLEAFHFLDAANTGQSRWTLTRLAPGVEYWFIIASNNRRTGVPQYSEWSNLLALTPASLTSSPDYAAQYPNCDAVRAHHPGGVKRGSPIYRPALDPDGDGTACEPSPSSVPSGDYLPIQNIGTFSGTGDNTHNVIRLKAGIYRFTTSRQNTNSSVRVDIVELSSGYDRSVGSLYSDARYSSELETINSAGYFQAGNYILEIDAGSDDAQDWSLTIELIIAH